MANLHGAARGLLALVLLVTGAAALPKHGTSRLLLEEMLERKATDSQFLADNSECSAQNWLFVVSAGRAGSTTIMNMMNAIPTVLLSGENDGVLNILDAAFSTSQRLANMWNQRPGTAYHNNPNMTALRSLVCSWVLDLLSTPSADMKRACTQQRCFRGFKELWGRTNLSTIYRFFPGAFIINNFRLGAAVKDDRTSTAGVNYFRNWTAIAEANKWVPFSHVQHIQEHRQLFGQRWLDVPLEEFSPSTFTEVLRWLGVGNCSFSRVVHSNDGSLGMKQWHTVPSTDGVLAGRCRTS